MPDASRSFDFAAWLPSPKALLWVLLAFVVGLLLFVLVWSNDRDEDTQGGEDALPAAAADEEYKPLPAPLPARRDGDAAERPLAEPDEQQESDQNRPRLVETAPPPPLPAPPMPAQPPAASYVSPQPIPGQTPSPRYPARALRRGKSGTVMIRAEIGPDGVPASVSIEQGSGSRALDRAARDAVRRWRFQPALRDGRPTTGSVVVPIHFDPG